MIKTVIRYIKTTLIFIFLLALCSSALLAQSSFEFNSREDANKKLLEKYRDELFDNDSYEKQLQQDSIGTIKDRYDKIKKKELGVKDSVSLEDVEQLIERQKEMIVRKALSLPEVEMYGHGFFRKNLLKLFDEEVKLRVPENYTLGVGDEVSIAIWGNSNYSRSFLINDDGSISPELVGRIALRGLTFAEAKSILKKKELFNPGTYTFPALNSVYNALVSIEGPNNMGSVRNIFVKRNGETIKTFDLYKYLTDPDSKQDFFLEDNDYVVVPSTKNMVAIEGEVKRPFTYELIEEEGIITRN